MEILKNSPLSFVMNRHKAEDKAVKDNIVILPRLESYIMPLSPEHYQSLEENILRNGVADPILLWKYDHIERIGEYEHDSITAHINSEDFDFSKPAYILVDGHNRYKICQKHNIDFSYKIVDFENLDAVKAYMDDWQMSRRNLTPEQASVLRARIAQRSGYKHGGARGQNDHLENRDTIAKKLGVSEKTIQRDAEFANGLDVLPWQLKQKVLSGKTRLDKATISNLPKALAKFPDFKITDEVSAQYLYQRYRESEAPKPPVESLPKKSNIPRGKTQETDFTGLQIKTLDRKSVV